MNNTALYRFSPIKNRAELDEAIRYVASTATKMMFKVAGNIVDIHSLTVFSHYEDEYRSLLAVMSGQSQLQEANNDVRFTLKTPMRIEAMRLEVNGQQHTNIQAITEVRIRKPDPYRMQVGCCDIDVSSGQFQFLEDSDGQHGDNSRLIERPDLRMIEYYHPDYDVLVYAVEP